MPKPIDLKTVYPLASSYQVEPGKSYLVVLRGTTTDREARGIARALNDLGVKSIVLNPSDGMEIGIFEVEAKTVVAAVCAHCRGPINEGDPNVRAEPSGNNYHLHCAEACKVVEPAIQHLKVRQDVEAARIASSKRLGEIQRRYDIATASGAQLDAIGLDLGVLRGSNTRAVEHERISAEMQRAANRLGGVHPDEKGAFVGGGKFIRVHGDLVVKELAPYTVSAASPLAIALADHGLIEANVSVIDHPSSTATALTKTVTVRRNGGTATDTLSWFYAPSEIDMADDIARLAVRLTRDLDRL